MTSRTDRPLITATDRVTAADWREAARKAAEALVEVGAADTGYPDACVRVVEKNGPYIVLTKGLALVHARPEEGGLAVGVGVTRLAEPVAFGHPDNDPVDLLLAFCTPDPDAHVGTLAGLARSLSGGLADRLRAASDEDDLAGVLKEAVPDD
ncbi:PTS sugar transporter subunit IIA [Actinomadura spongiicola]|uniref:Ascorbate-specific PTS system EIIA component n=1 Tax=Actinomadura spongiicola TaxID=2303421 RepID=A0A372GAJ3_9ACTN|nr:PTS sugar transporter subunit IIA [Actinomadura spongiicola]RFS82380.1 PTS sugar transporter subunit IIA [Actinomadura spongiicola]